MSKDDLFELRALSRVAATGSFSAAARNLGVEVSTITRVVSRTEARLGTRLFARSTHALALTDAGREYCRHIDRFLEQEASVRDAIRATRDASVGTLRLTTPVFVAERVLAPAIVAFLAKHPAARLEVHASDDRADLIAGAFDLAIRLGPLPDSTFRAQRVASFWRVLCASPELLARTGVPERPDDLASMPCLGYGAGPVRHAWSFSGANHEPVSVAVEALLRSNNLDLLVALAEAGVGVARIPFWAARAAIESGRLRPLLEKWVPAGAAEELALFAVFPADPGKARLRKSFLAELDVVLQANAPGTSWQTDRP